MRTVVFASLWWGLTEGAVDSWLVGVPAVIAAAVASCLLRAETAPRWKLAGAIRFAAFFVVESLHAGVDVARRAVTLNIAPRIIEYECSLDHDAARTLFCATVSLLPGTLTTEMEDGTVYVHTLDSRKPAVEELRRLEQHIAGMFGERTQAYQET